MWLEYFSVFVLYWIHGGWYHVDFSLRDGSNHIQWDVQALICDPLSIFDL